MFSFVFKWFLSISNDQLWLKRNEREAWEAMDVSNVIYQEDNDDEDEEIFFHK